MSSDQIAEREKKRPVIAAAFKRLARDLLPAVCYHVLSHSEDVLGEALLFAQEDKIPERELTLLAVAAAYHDIGFTMQMVENEELGAEEARRALLADGGFTAAEIETVVQAIRDTRVQSTAAGPRQLPTVSIAKYLIDADVSNLGREDFFEKAELVRAEMGAKNRPRFYRELLTFIESQQWYSAAAAAQRQAGKARNVALLRERLAKNYYDQE